MHGFAWNTQGKEALTISIEALHFEQITQFEI